MIATWSPSKDPPTENSVSLLTIESPNINIFTPFRATEDLYYWDWSLFIATSQSMITSFIYSSSSGCYVCLYKNYGITLVLTLQNLLASGKLWNEWGLRGLDHNKRHNGKAGESLCCIFQQFDEYNNNFNSV